MRLFPTPQPSWSTDRARAPYDDSGPWRASWIKPQGPESTPAVWLTRLLWEEPVDRETTLFVSADERYELWLDGLCLGHGPHRSDLNHWPYEAYRVTLKAGSHRLIARVSHLGADTAPFAQLGCGEGFILGDDDREGAARIDTGTAAWETTPLTGLRWNSPLDAWGTGKNLEISAAAFPWNWETEDPAEATWSPARTGECGNGFLGQGLREGAPRLQPAAIPAQLSQPWKKSKIVAGMTPATSATAQIPWQAEWDAPTLSRWQTWMDGASPLTLSPYSRFRVLIDPGDYLCAFPELTVSGGNKSRIRLHWAEGLFLSPETEDKGLRHEWAGKFFCAARGKEDGIGDIFLPDGSPQRTFRPLWWQAGRWIELVIETHEDPLVLEKLVLRETRYPLPNTPCPATSDPRMGAVWNLARRALQVCAHESYMDCPYYEQLMYTGDTRLEILTTYCLTPDSALPRHAINQFARSLQAEGITLSRTPCRRRQYIPPFSLAFVGMVRDYAWWQDDPTSVQKWLPVTRIILATHLAQLREDGWFTPLPDWNFVDWVVEWDIGRPPFRESELSTILAAQVLLALKEASEVEDALGDPAIAATYRNRSAQMAEAIDRDSWNPVRGLYADQPEQATFSEHTQCLLLLADAIPEPRRAQVIEALFADPTLSRTTVYFSHYLFEVCALAGRMDALQRRFQYWFDLPAQGFYTVPERPEPSRSDCHAWGSHVIFHLFATLAGVRPAAPGFRKISIQPQPGWLDSWQGELPTPHGTVRLSLVAAGEDIVIKEKYIPDGIAEI